MSARGYCMARPRRPRKTPIERIYRKVTGKKMPLAVKRILVKSRKPKDGTQGQLNRSTMAPW